MANVATHKEPLVRIAKRDSIPFWKSTIVRLISIVLALIVCGGIIYLLVKVNPLEVYKSMVEGAFGSFSKDYKFFNRRTWITIRDTMMLLCIAVGLAPAFKMRFWNIGAEGQILVGGIATAACMIYLKDLPPVVLFICMVVTSLLAGAIWSFLPALFKAKWNTNETLFTLMMNYVAIQLTSFFVALWENPYGSNTVGVINPTGHEGWFPSVFGQDYLLNVIVVMIVTVGMFIYLKYSKQGYEIAVVGDSENTARYAGINVKKVIIRTMLISGAICGLSGFVAVSGASHTISISTAGGKGFTAIIVAWLAKFNTFTMILISMLLVFLDKGAIEIASKYDLNDYVASMITGIILFFILGSEFFINYRMIFRHKNKEVQ
ncbi:MAG: ABC transporter permease [Ruminococcaceae bacterium]|nr:ABC transporter permease [Oscillospiraceae bacterium]